LVDAAVPVVVAAVQDLFVDAAVAVVVNVRVRAGIARVQDAHRVGGVQRGPPLEHRSTRDPQLALLGAGADPQLRVIQQLLPAAARELERRIEREALIEERIAEHADVRDAHREPAGVQDRPTVVDVHHRAAGLDEQADREHGRDPAAPRCGRPAARNGDESPPARSGRASRSERGYARGGPCHNAKFALVAAAHECQYRSDPTGMGVTIQHRFERWRAPIAAAALCAAAVASCSKDKLGGTLLPNQPPTVELSQVPANSDTTGTYAYEVSWAGFDADGRVVRFWYAVDPPSAALAETAWVKTTDNRRLFIFRSDSVSSGSATRARGFHTV